MNDNLELSIGRYYKIMPSFDDPVLIALKGHLLIEELLQKIIINNIPNPNFINDARLNFYQRARLARALVNKNSAESLDPWRSIDALNSLRNTFVHSLEPSDLDKKIDKFIFARFEGKPLRKFKVASERIAGLRRELATICGMLDAILFWLYPDFPKAKAT